MEKIQQTGVGMEQTRYRYLDIARGIGILSCHHIPRPRIKQLFDQLLYSDIFRDFGLYLSQWEKLPRKYRQKGKASPDTVFCVQLCAARRLYAAWAEHGGDEVFAVWHFLFKILSL